MGTVFGTSDPWRDLETVEQCLAAALRLPMQETVGAPHPTDPKYKPETHLQYREALREFDGRGSDLVRIAGNRRSAVDLSVRDAGLFNVRSWLGRVGHWQVRLELIETLIELREAAFRVIRRLPPDGPQPTRVHWLQLTDKQRDVLEALSGQQLLIKQVEHAIGRSAQKELLKLKALGIVENRPRAGYWIQVVPEGAPASVRPFDAGTTSDSGKA